MPIIKSAVKRMHQTAKSRARNVELKKSIKSATKAFQAAPSAETLSAVQRAIDTAVKKGLLKKNTAARRKSRIANQAKEAGVKLSTGTTEAASTAKAATPKKTEAAKSTTTAKKAPAKKAATTTTAKKTTASKKAE